MSSEEQAEAYMEEARLTFESARAIEESSGERDDMAALASMTPGDLHGLAADLANGLRKEEGHRLAGLALPFATDARFTTASRGLSTC